MDYTYSTTLDLHRHTITSSIRPIISLLIPAPFNHVSFHLTGRNEYYSILLQINNNNRAVAFFLDENLLFYEWIRYLLPLALHLLWESGLLFSFSFSFNGMK